MAAIDVPCVLSGLKDATGQVNAAGERAFVTETWQDLLVMTFQPGRARVKLHAKALPTGYEFTGHVALWMGMMGRAWMHRGGDVNAWASHPLTGRPAAWVEAQVKTPSGVMGYAGVAGWSAEGAIFDLVPEGIRLARQSGVLSFEHRVGMGVLAGRIEADGPAMAYRVGADGLEAASGKEPEGLWNSARISGSFSFASAGNVLVMGGKTLWLKRPGDAVINQAGGEGPLRDLIHPSALMGVCFRLGETTIVRCAHECMSGPACATGWSMAEPG